MCVHQYSSTFWVLLKKAKRIYGYLGVLVEILVIAPFMSFGNKPVYSDFLLFPIYRDLTNNRIGCLNADIFRGLVSLIRL